MGSKKETVGIIVGGGPAPGINGVISSATIEAINEGRQVVGIVGGFKRLFDGDEKCAIPLAISDVSRLHSEGGSILRTSRDYPDKAREKFKTLLATLKKIGVRHLVTIGGEGTLFMANWIEKEGRGAISVAHVPKTIDNDIPLPGGVSTFGYQTARHVGTFIVSNLMEDAKTTGRWYFITTMGRHAGHLALGIGKAAGATISLIPEEFKAGKMALRSIGDVLAGSIIKRLSMGRDHGVAILAEGLTDLLDPEELRKYEVCQLDETGRLRLSEILLGRILKVFVGETLESFGIKMTIVDKNVGYELRAAHPIPFDVDYTRSLGYGAVRFLLRGGTGAVIVVEEGHMRPIPFVEMMDYSTGRVKVRTVDTQSINYEVARKYMIRLEREDFEGKALAQLAKTAGLKPDEFRERFSHVL